MYTLTQYQQRLCSDNLFFRQFDHPALRQSIEDRIGLEKLMSYPSVDEVPAEIWQEVRTCLRHLVSLDAYMQEILTDPKSGSVSLPENIESEIIFWIAKEMVKELQLEWMAELKKIGASMVGQDNIATSYPVYAVQKRRSIPVDPEYGCDGYIYLDEESTIVGNSEEDGDFDTFVANICAQDDTANKENFREAAFLYVWDTEEVFFSYQAAKDFTVRRNAISLENDCYRVFVLSGCRNEEWKTIQSVLYRLNGAEVPR